ncbi:diguanylate cyclase [Pseudanabaena sp. FACHB-2040]|uniref:diguanylate cyclase domain-containing protein n=1 Tax=Pseudanabaena sp. FACHB-2040 TaxID=2692859 RepID=UPI00168688EF|nr:diguanylate cyclase [Pseudanabaena sp. FACHB-2040]MBD2258810.1 diguanylate cyclase [Pseudanabaena sp. FACHB-2040]
MANVLIVEDEPIAAWNIREALEQLGHQIVDEVTSGQQAIDTARLIRPDLVLMDIRLTGEIDGIEAAETIQGHLSIPVIFLTAYADEMTVQRAIATSPFGYIVKPFRWRELQTSIEIALHRHRQEKHLESAESQLLTTLESLGDGTVTTDSEGLVNFLNPVAEVLTGWSRQTAIGQPVEAVLVLLEAQTEIQAKIEPHLLRQALQRSGGWPLSQDCLLQTRQGTTRYISISAASIRDQPGRLLGGVLVFRDITERKQLEQRLRQQAEREQILSTIALAIRQSLNLEVVLKTTTEAVQQLLQVNRVIIYRLEPDGSGSVIAESLAGDYTSMQDVVLHDPCLTAPLCLEKYRSGYVQAIADLQTAGLSDCYLALLEPFQVRAHLVVPILTRQQQLWGLLVAQQCVAPRSWQGMEIDLMQQISLQVGIAIQQSQLYEQSRRQAHQEALLNEIVQAIRTSLNLDQVLHQTAERLISAFAVSRSVIRLGRDTDDSFVYSVSQAASDVEVLSDKTMPITDNPLVQALFEREAVVAIADVAAADWLRSLQPYFQRNGIQAWLGIAIRFEGKVRGMLCLQQCDRTRTWLDDEAQLATRVADQLAVTIQQVELYRRLHRANQELNRLAHLDGLTQVANRRFFDEYLETEFRRQRRYNTCLTLILCDVDHFKQFNDTYGHLAGDDCLRAIAQTLSQVLKRPGDLLARYGGEEFAIVLPDTPLEGAIALAENILTAIRQLQIAVTETGPLAQVTVSLGIASLDIIPTDAPAGLILAADQALYLAKAQGRNRYCLPFQPQSEELKPSV